MNAQAILGAATSDGLVVDLSSTGGLKIVGDEQVVARWAPTLKQHKAEIISLFSGESGGATESARPLPEWCRLGCPGMEMIPVPGEGKVLGCVDPRTAIWKRLDWLQSCPADEIAPEPPLPEFCCGRACERFHRVAVPGLGVLCWCCLEIDKTHWRQDRVDAMTECPMGKDGR